jgi:hypothetical protein
MLNQQPLSLDAQESALLRTAPSHWFAKPQRGTAPLHGIFLALAVVGSQEHACYKALPVGYGFQLVP